MADTRSNIVDAATQLFATQGYAATSVREVADAVGIGSSLVHHHYSTKEALLMACVHRVVSDFGERLGLTLEKSSGASLRDTAFEAARCCVRWANSRPEGIRLLGLVGVTETQVLDDEQHREVFVFEFSRHWIPLASRLEHDYGERGISALVHRGADGDV